MGTLLLGSFVCCAEGGVVSPVKSRRTDGAALCIGAFVGLFDAFGIKDGVIDGTAESKLNVPATFPSLSRTLPSFTLLKQHGNVESPSGDSIISIRIISIVSATSTYAMSDN